MGTIREDYVYAPGNLLSRLSVVMSNLEGHVLPDTSHAEFQFESYDPLMDMDLTFNANSRSRATNHGHASLIGEIDI